MLAVRLDSSLQSPAAIWHCWINVVFSGSSYHTIGRSSHPFFTKTRLNLTVGLSADCYCLSETLIGLDWMLWPRKTIKHFCKLCRKAGRIRHAKPALSSRRAPAPSSVPARQRHWLFIFITRTQTALSEKEVGKMSVILVSVGFAYPINQWLINTASNNPSCMTQLCVWAEKNQACVSADSLDINAALTECTLQSFTALVGWHQG